MSTEPHEPLESPTFDPQRAFQIGVGVASPLWPAFTAAAAGGLAFWWWSRLARGERPELFAEDPSFAPKALEAMETVAKAAEPVAAALAEVMAAPVEALIEVAAEAATVAEAATEMVAEAMQAAADEATDAAEAVVEAAAEAAEPVLVLDPVVEAPVAVEVKPPPVAEAVKPAVSRLDKSLAAWAATTPKTQVTPKAEAPPKAAAPKSAAKKPAAKKPAARAKSGRKAPPAQASAPKT